MIIRDPSDLLTYLVKTGPITLEELVIRTDTEMSDVASDLVHLIDSGDVEVEGNQSAVKEALKRFEEGSSRGAEFGPSSVRGDFFAALAASDAQTAKLRLSSRGFRKVRP